MKNVILLLLFAIAFCGFSFGQTSTDVPNYIKAKNSNFMVQFISFKGMEVPKNKKLIQASKLKNMEGVDSKEYKDFDEGLYVAICLLMMKEFEKLDMHPSAFLFMDPQDMQNSEFVKEMTANVVDTKPGFVLTLFSMSVDDAKKSFPKNKLSLRDLHGSITIAKYGETDPAKSFTITKSNLKASEAFEELSAKVSEKPESYFVETMDVEETAFNSETADEYIEQNKLFMEDEFVDGFPDEADLESNEILVMVPCLKEGDMSYNMGIKQLEKFYPYKYQVITHLDYKKYVDKGYKYMIYAKSPEAEVTKTKTNTKTGTSSQSSYSTFAYFFVIKEIETSTVYYGSSKESAMKNASLSTPEALKSFLKMMQNHYGWEKN
ncbi:MAG: hypothetical protein KKA07_08325 [Bacteroidetes bacterium]|nr:hypothetical protein [Bacteroidota bacterium]MBU1719066.1 hypothetical protein [Bacteroidota bacterium]